MKRVMKWTTKKLLSAAHWLYAITHKEERAAMRRRLEEIRAEADRMEAEARRQAS